LSAAVIAPAFDTAIDDGTGMTEAGRNCAGAGGDAHHVNRHIALRGGAIAQLAETIGAPTQ